MSSSTSEGHGSPVIYNTLTKNKDLFVPLHSNGQVGWYACGPTVYDDAHLGHARNYVSTDIIRRIMINYFKYDVKFVMNITDVDDKIILRGRQQHILENSKRHWSSSKDVLETATLAYRAYAQKNAPRLPSNFTPARYPQVAEEAYGTVLRGGTIEGDKSIPGDAEAKLKMHLKTLATASGALLVAEQDTIPLEDFYDQTEDILLPYLDSLLSSSIDASDHTIFTKLTQQYETRFMEDMRALNVLDPDAIVRVTEHIPHIIKYVEGIIRNNFGYSTSDGSVYFDQKAFAAEGNKYAPMSGLGNNLELQADGEGSLTRKNTEKRSDGDFALWKSSKPGEPSWDSPWGKGRPGWHIECSAMASHHLGQTMDMHSGGIDLVFPHHDNEIAQAEAYHAKDYRETPHSHGDHLCDQRWVKYFLHMGHLSISGAKMSKSLKNFTTIRDALGRGGGWTPRGLRIIFLFSAWRDGVEIVDSLLNTATNWEEKVDNFFVRVRNLMELPLYSEGASEGESNEPLSELSIAARDPSSNENTDIESSASRATHISNNLSAAKSEVELALRDSFDTPKAMRAISDLITAYNSAKFGTVTYKTTMEIAKWVSKMIRMFGLDWRPGDAARIGWEGIDIEQASKPFVYRVSQLRDTVRRRARSGRLDPDEMIALSLKSVATKQQPIAAIEYAEILSEFEEEIRSLAARKAPAEDYLVLSDDLRDRILWNKGIFLEDALEEGQPALIGPVTTRLIDDRVKKVEREREKQLAKTKREEDGKLKAAEKAEKGKLRPDDMFRTDEFSEWDAQGLPIKDAQGKEITKNRMKKLLKQSEAQAKLHEVWRKQQNG